MNHLRWRSYSLLAAAVALSAMLWACSGNDTSNVTSPTADNSLLAAVNAHSADFDNAVTAHRAVTPDIMKIPGVVGTAVTADEHGMPLFVVYTRSQLAPGLVKNQYDGFRVIQQVTGDIRPMKGPPGGGGGGGGGGTSGQAKQTPPVQMGTSGGWRYDLANGYCCGGTLGSLVQKNGTKYVMSNYHVLYSDIVNGGNGRTAQPGDPVIQPGLIDVSCSASNAQDIATLVTNGGTLPDANNPNAVDVGIAAVISGMVDESGAILNVGTISATTLNGSIGLAVKKMGRTTGLTRSTISAIDGSFSITYENECAGGTSFTQSYNNQIVISNDRCKFQNAGDSGSLLLEDVDTNPRAVGLCFAGSSVCARGSIAIANPIGAVLNKIGATMVGQ